MALPYTIANGQMPDGNKLQANFAYLLAAVSIPSIAIASYTAHKATALAAPTVIFTCIADGTDGGPKGYFLYCADATAGDQGFIQIVGWGE